jgi:hypothetical protein
MIILFDAFLTAENAENAEEEKEEEDDNLGNNLFKSFKI